MSQDRIIVINEGQKYKLDLNGKTIICLSENYGIENIGELEIVDSSTNGTIVGNRVNLIKNEGFLKISGGKLSVSLSSNNRIIYNTNLKNDNNEIISSGTISINGGKLYGNIEKKTNVSVYGIYSDSIGKNSAIDNSTVLVESGNFEIGYISKGQGNYNIYNIGEGSKIKIAGGVLQTTSNNAGGKNTMIYNKNEADIEVVGGTIGIAEQAINLQKGNLDITGGTIIGSVSISNNGGSVTATGGTINGSIKNNSGMMNLTGLTVSMTSSNYDISNAGEMNINGGAYSFADGYGSAADKISNSGIMKIGEISKVNIRGGAQFGSPYRILKNNSTGTLSIYNAIIDNSNRNIFK